jgi:hypothetical protein
MEMKKYMDVTRLGHRTTIGVLNEGDHIVIQEKLDGANASFRRDGDKLVAFSRNTQLSDENTLGGFYQFVQELNIHIGEGLIFYGEWLNPHKVKYPEYEKTFWLYDVYDTSVGKYLSFDYVRALGETLGLNIIPVFYEGVYQGFEHLQSFVGKTALGGKLGDIDTGEGIVVKNVDYTDRFGNQIFVKLVTDVFREVQKQKAPKDPQELTQEQIFVHQTVTEARVEKFLHKFVDEGILESTYGIEDMGTILKNMNPRIKEDILKEERDMLPEEYDENKLNKAINRTVAQTVKKLLTSA